MIAARPKRILCIAGGGGHVEELYECLDAFDGHEVRLAHYDWSTLRDFRHRNLTRCYGIFLGGDKGMRLLIGTILTTFQWLWILLTFRPHILFATGAELAIIPFWLARVLLRSRCIFLETAARKERPSGTAPFVYPVCETFLVQSEALLKHLGPKARYAGRLM
jgi:UDP-N-acetylglucosamine:LPS N-acetylglucosamine transferase